MPIRTDRRDFDMPTIDDDIRRILCEASEGLFASDIAEHLNRELGPHSAYKSVDIANYVKGMSNLIAQLPDGRWMLKRLML
jgi:hypothetical protein